MFSHARRSVNGTTIPSWLKPGPIYVKRHVRNNHEPQLIHDYYFKTFFHYSCSNSEFAIMVPPGGEATPNSSNPSHTLQL